MSVAVVIPARYESSRFPGKPLAQIAGAPMIVQTWRRVADVVDRQSIWVVTDDKRIVNACRTFGIRAVLTGPAPTGTDRVAKLLHKLAADTVINVQGDEPTLPAVDLGAVLETARRFPGEVIGACAMAGAEQMQERAIVKVVTDKLGRLLYASRAPIPGCKVGPTVSGLRQVGIYAFPRHTLAAFAASRRTRLEEREDVEILRLLELGYGVRMVTVSGGSVAVDRPGDAAEAEKRIRARGLA